ESENLTETFDPQTPILNESQALINPPQLTGSIPQDGAIDVPLDSDIALRFSKPLRVETVNANTLTLSHSEGRVATKVIPAEGGRLAFVTPKERLLPGITYTLTLDGPTDGASPLAATSVSFTTAKGEPSDEANAR